jgi:subtilisin-like proprotein convertase family protein
LKNRKNILAAIWAFFCVITTTNAQTFTQSVPSLIPDNNTLTFYPLTVSGLPATIDSTNFGLLSACVNVNHNFMGSLDAYIKSPDGTLIKLSNNRGGGGRNFTNTCFKEDGAIPIGQGLAPFTGTFIPEQTINAANNGQNPNGVWQLGIHDEVPYNVGQLLNFSITFGNNPPKTPESTICSITNGRNCKCPDGTQNCELLPDITNSERIIEENLIEFNGYVRLGVGTPNIGYGPIEIRGTPNCYCDSVKVDCSIAICPNGKEPRQQVVQRIYSKDSARITYVDKPAGYMVHHPTHGHTHLDDFSLNSIRLSGPDKNPLTWPILGTDKKVSFCLVNLSDCNAIPGACKDKNGNTLTYNQVGNPGMGTVSGCGTEQGIYPGYIDIYYPGYEGQDVFFGNVCNGWYNVVSAIDPKGYLYESDKQNNIAVVPVYLSQQMGDCCQTDFVADTVFGAAPLTVQFSDRTMPLSEKWRWNFGDGDTSNTAHPIHTYTRAGMYDVSLNTVAKGTNCNGVSVKRKLIHVLPATNTADANNIVIYPIPFNNELKVYFQLKTKQQVTIALFDATGRMMLQQVVQNATVGANQVLLNTKQFLKGVYVVKVLVDGVYKSFKVVK